MKEILTALRQHIEAGEPAALATVVEVTGASPAQVGFKLLVRSDGSVVGNVGGGALEGQVRGIGMRQALMGRWEQRCWMAVCWWPTFLVSCPRSLPCESLIGGTICLNGRSG
jgi:hypothetical protein